MASPQFIIHEPHEAESAIRPTIPRIWIEIERGATAFPLRGIDSDRFLIGAGTNCHLQVGGDMPFLHCVLHQSGDDWSIEAIAAEPKLLVNGIKQRQSRLYDGDRIEIAPFRLRLRLTALEGPVSRIDDSCRSVSNCESS